MAWTTPKTYVAGEKHSAAEGNTYIRDNIQYLYDNAGTFLLDSYTVADTDIQTVTFDSISGDFSNLLARFSVNSQRDSANDLLGIYVNGDVDTDIYQVMRVITGSGAGVQALASWKHIVDDASMDVSTNGLYSVGDISICNYSSTTEQKAALTRITYRNGQQIQFHWGQYLSTTAITSVSFTATYAPFGVGSKIWLYGEA